MIILALDTSSVACSVALRVDEDVITLHKIAPMQQANLILPMIDELIKIKKIQLNQIEAIAFGCGPGSFTGIRIATSVAQGLGYALNIPLIPISSLAAFAQTATDLLGWEHNLVVVDARMQEVYWGLYKTSKLGEVELVGKESLDTPNRLNALNDLVNMYGIGNAWDIYINDLPKLTQVDAKLLPTAEAILKLAVTPFNTKKWSTADDVLPVYLRNEVATKEKKR